MNNESLGTYQKFSDLELAEEIASILKGQNIPYFIENNTSVLDPIIGGISSEPNYLLKIRREDFIKANQALEQHFKNELDNTDNDYYLNSFTKDELREVITKSDEWGLFDQLLAQKLLKEKGEKLDQEEIESLREGRLKQIAKPESENGLQIVIGYFFAFLFPPLGLILGWIWGYSKKTLPNGRKVYSYTEREQENGRRIIVISAVVLTFNIVSGIIYHLTLYSLVGY